MTDLATIPVGTMLWSRGQNAYGDNRVGGMFIREATPTDDGEPCVLILTNSALQPRQHSVILKDGRKTTNSYGAPMLLHRLQSLKVADIDPHAADSFRSVDKVWKHARFALIAAAFPPADRFGSELHTDLVAAYWVLRDEAIMLSRGVGTA